MRALLLLLAAIMLGLTGGYAWSTLSAPSSGAAAPSPLPPGHVPESRAEVEQSAHFKSCAAAIEAEKAPLYAGSPGYRADLDPDGDGIACHPS